MIAGMTVQELRHRLERIADSVEGIGIAPWSHEADPYAVEVANELRELAFELTLSSPPTFPLSDGNTTRS